MDRGFQKAKKHLADWKKQADKEKDVELGADSSDLDKALKANRKSLAAYKKDADKTSRVSLTGDSRGLTDALKTAGRALTGFKNTARREGNLTITGDASGFTRSLQQSSSALKTFKRDVQRDGSLTITGDASGFVRSLGESSSALARFKREASSTNAEVDVDTGAAMRSVGTLADFTSRELAGSFNFASTTARNVFRLAIPAAVAAGIASLQPLMGGVGVGGSAVASVVSGFGLIGLAANETFSRVEIENGKLVAKTGATLTKSQRMLVDNLNRAGKSYRGALAPANDAFNRFFSGVVDDAERAFPYLGRVAERSTNAVAGAWDTMSRKLTTPKQLESFRRLLDSAPGMSARLTRAAGSFFGGVTNILSEAVPQAKGLSGWVEETGDNLLSWSRSKAGREDLRDTFRTSSRLAGNLAEGTADVARGLWDISQNDGVQNVLNGLVTGTGNVVRNMGKLADRHIGTLNDVFDLDVAGIGRQGGKAGDATVDAYNQAVRGRKTGEGTASYEMGYKSMQALISGAKSSANRNGGGVTGAVKALFVGGGGNGGGAQSGNPIIDWMTRQGAQAGKGYRDALVDEIGKTNWGRAAFKGQHDIKKQGGIAGTQVGTSYRGSLVDQFGKARRQTSDESQKMARQWVSGLGTIERQTKQKMSGVTKALVGEANEAKNKGSRASQEFRTRWGTDMAAVQNKTRNTMAKTTQDLLREANEAQKKGGQASQKFRTQWGTDMAQAGSKTKQEMGKTKQSITTFTSEAAREGSKNSSNLKANMGRSHSDIATQTKAKMGMMEGSVTSKSNAAKESGSRAAATLKTNTDREWTATKNNASARFTGIETAVRTKSWDAENSSTNAWQSLSSFVSNVLSRLGIGGGSSGSGTPSGKTPKTSPQDRQNNGPASGAKMARGGVLRNGVRHFALGGYVNTGDISSGRADRLMSRGWRGNPNDSQERLYRPGSRVAEDGSTVRPGFYSNTSTGGASGISVRMFAGGGVTPQDAVGGVVRGIQPHAVYGEAGSEAYVRLDKRTKESEHALMTANEEWSKRGWLREHHHMAAGGILKAWKRMGTRMFAYGGGPSDGTLGTRGGSSKGTGSPDRLAHGGGTPGGQAHHNVNDEIRSRANEVASATGTYWNSYPGHGELGGAVEQNTVDFWGGPTVGTPIGKSAGFATASQVLDKFQSDLMYIIRQGEMWRGAWKPWPSDPHYDHTHVSWGGDGSGGFGGGAGGSMGPIPNPKQILFDQLWKPIQAAADAVFNPMKSAAFWLSQAGGGLGSKTTTSIHDWIDEQIPDTIMGATGGGASGNFSGSQAAVALEFAKNAVGRGIPGRLPVMTALVESGMRNLDYGDADSLGYFQQRPSQGWGSPEQIMDPAYALGKFLDAAEPLKGQYSNTATGLGAWAQAVQRSAYPDRYAGEYDNAASLIGDPKYYARGGVSSANPKLGMSGRTESAFKTVADALNRMVGGKENGALRSERGRGQVTEGITGIAGEAGRESIVPLERRTPEGEHALKTAMRVHHPEVRMFADGGLSGYVSKANDLWGFSGTPLPFRFGPLPGSAFGVTKSGSGVTIDPAMWASASENMRLFGVLHERGHAEGYYSHLGYGNVMQPGGKMAGGNPTSPTSADREAVGAPANGDASFGEPPSGSGRPSGTVPRSGSTNSQTITQRQSTGSLPPGLFAGNGRASAGSSSAGSGGARAGKAQTEDMGLLMEVRALRREMRDMPEGMLESMLKNNARGPRTQESLGRGVGRRNDRQMMGGPALSRAR